MAKQIIFLAFIIFFAAVGMASDQEKHVPSAAAALAPAAVGTASSQEKHIPSAAAALAPAAASAGLNVTRANELIGALSGAAKDGAPVGGPIPEGAFKDLVADAKTEQPKSGAQALMATAAAGSVAAAGVVGSFFLF